MNRDKLLVKKHNQEIERKKDSLNTIQLQVMNIVISKINNNLKLEEITDEDLRFEISKNELEFIFDGNLFSRFQSSMKDLSKKQIEVLAKNPKYKRRKEEFEFVNIFSSIRYVREFLIVKINKEIIEYYINLNKDFTQYLLINILEFKSKYSILLYELLKSYQYKTYKNKIEFSIESLYQYLQVEGKGYFLPMNEEEKNEATIIETKKIQEETESGKLKKPLTPKEVEDRIESHRDIPHPTNFRKKILDTSIIEINKESDLRIDYEPVKVSGRIEKIRFTILNKEDDLKRLKTKSTSDLSDWEQLLLSAELLPDGYLKYELISQAKEMKRHSELAIDLNMEERISKRIEEQLKEKIKG